MLYQRTLGCFHQRIIFVWIDSFPASFSLMKNCVAISLSANTISIFMARTVVICHSDGLVYFAIFFLSQIFNNDDDDYDALSQSLIPNADYILSIGCIIALHMHTQIYWLLIHRLFFFLCRNKIWYSNLLGTYAQYFCALLSFISQPMISSWLFSEIPQRLQNTDLYSRLKIYGMFSYFSLSLPLSHSIPFSLCIFFDFHG